MYKTLNEHYKEKFGGKVYKLAIDGGFTCPNRDGTKGVGGCIFCSASGSGDFAEKKCGSITEQLERAKRRVEDKFKGDKFIAYFQSFTNTYASVNILRELYMEAISPDYIVGLSIGTRPDCLDDSKIKLLSQINKIKPVSVELGLQTIHKSTIDYIRRGYENEVYLDTVKRLRDEDIEVVTHIILGLPGESSQMMSQTTSFAVEAKTDGIKFHLLHVLCGTDLEKDYNEGKFECLSLEEYGKILKECLDILPPQTVVHRITGDGAKKYLIAPLWSADKKRVLNYLKGVLG